jgi:hypothetical protein
MSLNNSVGDITPADNTPAEESATDKMKAEEMAESTLVEQVHALLEKSEIDNFRVTLEKDRDLMSDLFALWQLLSGELVLNLETNYILSCLFLILTVSIDQRQCTMSPLETNHYQSALGLSTTLFGEDLKEILSAHGSMFGLTLWLLLTMTRIGIYAGTLPTGYYHILNMEDEKEHRDMWTTAKERANTVYSFLNGVFPSGTHIMESSKEDNRDLTEGMSVQVFDLPKGSLCHYFRGQTTAIQSLLKCIFLISKFPMKHLNLSFTSVPDPRNGKSWVRSRLTIVSSCPPTLDTHVWDVSRLKRSILYDEYSEHPPNETSENFGKGKNFGKGTDSGKGYGKGTDSGKGYGKSNGPVKGSDKGFGKSKGYAYGSNSWKGKGKSGSSHYSYQFPQYSSEWNQWGWAQNTGGKSTSKGSRYDQRQHAPLY